MASAFAATTPVDGGSLQVRPDPLEIGGDYGCVVTGQLVNGPDATQSLNGMTWSTWTSMRATVTAYYHISTVLPGVPVHAILSEPRTLHAHLVFTRLRLTFPGKPPRAFPTGTATFAVAWNSALVARTGYWCATPHGGFDSATAKQAWRTWRTQNKFPAAQKGPGYYYVGP